MEHPVDTLFYEAIDLMNVCIMLDSSTIIKAVLGIIFISTLFKFFREKNLKWTRDRVSDFRNLTPNDNHFRKIFFNDCQISSLLLKKYFCTKYLSRCLKNSIAGWKGKIIKL